jgi:hypothetical protein
LELLPALPPTVRPGIRLNAADFYSRIEPDAILAREHLEAARRDGIAFEEALLLAEAAVLLAEGKNVEAIATVERCGRFLEVLGGSSLEMYLETVEEIRAKASRQVETEQDCA